MIADRSPGALFAQGVAEVSKYLGEREGAVPDNLTHSARMVAYLNTVFHGRHSQQEVGPRTSHEMKVLAQVMDALVRGEVPRLADLLMQRFKALELSVDEKSWAIASHLEVSSDSKGLATLEERQAAGKHAMLHKRLAELKLKASVG